MSWLVSGFKSSFGLEGLSQFGPKFLSHLHLKTLPNPRLEKVTLVDTPGMIDSADASASRGYDLECSTLVCRTSRFNYALFRPRKAGHLAKPLKYILMPLVILIISYRLYTTR